MQNSTRSFPGLIRGFLQGPKIVRRFRKEDDGTTAIEFAMLAFPFFLLLFGIIECSLLFFAGQMLESAVDDVGRRVRTGQLDNTMTEQQFKDEICTATALLFDCDDLAIDLKIAATFDDLEEPPIPDAGVVDHTAFTFSAPCPEQIAMITVSTEWPIFTNYVAAHVSNLNSGNALLNAMAVFRTEPYPAAGGGC
ncbi:MAG: TadE/TadG family type IV pilus assembly protein [Rhizobiaceae bacterium]